MSFTWDSFLFVSIFFKFHTFPYTPTDTQTFICKDSYCIDKITQHSFFLTQIRHLEFHVKHTFFDFTKALIFFKAKTWALDSFAKFKESVSRLAKSDNIYFFVFLHTYNVLSIVPLRNPLHSKGYGICGDPKTSNEHDTMCACALMCIWLFHSAQKVNAATTTRE